MELTPPFAPPVTQEGAWSAYTEFGIEAEVGLLLYSLVRALKPILCLESGTGEGYSAWFIAKALEANGVGALITYEPDTDYANTARRNLEGLPVDVRTIPPTEADADFVFLDSGPELRPGEIEYWLTRPTTLAVHDSHRYDLPGGVTFPTIRGVWIRRNDG